MYRAAADKEMGQISRLVPRRSMGVDITWSHRMPSRAAASHCLTTHGNTDGLNPNQHAIGEPPPFAHAIENRTSCLILQKLVSRCRRTKVDHELTIRHEAKIRAVVFPETRSMLRCPKERCVPYKGLYDHQQDTRIVRQSVWARGARQSLPLRRDQCQTFPATRLPTNKFSSIASSSGASTHGGATGTTVIFTGSGRYSKAHPASRSVTISGLNAEHPGNEYGPATVICPCR